MEYESILYSCAISGNSYVGGNDVLGGFVGCASAGNFSFNNCKYSDSLTELVIEKLYNTGETNFSYGKDIGKVNSGSAISNREFNFNSKTAKLKRGDNTDTIQ